MGKSDIVSLSPKELGVGYKLSDNIVLGEFMSKGADGSEPTPVDMELIRKLQQMRDLLGAVHINSGYRTPKHNASQGGAPNSYHVHGQAADVWFGAAAMRVPDELAAQCAQYLGFKGIGLYTGWVHVDTREAPYYYRQPGNTAIAVPKGFPGYPAPKPQESQKQNNQEIIQAKCKFTDPQPVWEAIETHAFPEELLQKWADSYK